MGRALYRTYRSKNLSEIVGQEHITTALDRALKKGTISHAYLFTGPRGVGKTSIARILAHEINGLPYEDDANHLDIIEIDAASNRRIDEIRDLRDKVHTAPTSAKYKVYIIDEVHMLTKEAFNALLKTLEEPPAHVVFILATTEVHKLPETIISRTQRFAFKPVDRDKVVAHLKHIAAEEKIIIDDAALDLIAAHGEGSFRDSISLLDQVRNSGDKIVLADVQATLGIAPATIIKELLAAISAHDAPKLVTTLQSAHAGGYEPSQMARQLGAALRDSLLSGKAELSNEQLLSLLARLIEVPASSDPKSNLEIALLDAALSGVAGSNPVSPAKPKPATKVLSEEVQQRPAVQVEPHPSSVRRQMAEAAEEEEESEAEHSDAVIDSAKWPEILAAIKQKHNTLYSIVHTTTPHFEPGLVTLESSFAFHQKKLNEKATKKTVADVIQAITGHNVRIVCVKGESRAPDTEPTARALPPADGEQIHAVGTVLPGPLPTPPADTPPTKEVATISNIFGGAELLES
jgi:DNA polymerase-3 subunit gamma/tau